MALVTGIAVLHLAAPPASAAAGDPPIDCAAGKIPLRFNRTWTCVPAPPNTDSGALKALARSLSAPGFLRDAGASRGARSLDQAHRATLRAFYSSVLLDSWRVHPPAPGQPKKVVTFDFPDGKFDGFPVRASETLRPRAAGGFGSPRSTTFAIALRGKLPSAASTTPGAGGSGPEWVKVSDSTSVRAEQCPNSDGVLHIDATGADVVTFNSGGDTSQVTATVTSTVRVYVNDNAEVYFPVNQYWHVRFSPDNGFRADGETWHFGKGVGRSVMDVTDHGAPLGGIEALDTFVDLDPVIERVHAAASGAYQQAQAYWKSGKCLDAGFSPSAPDPLKPGQRLEEKVTIRRRDDQTTVRRARLTATISPGGTVSPSEAITGSSGSATFTITAPSTVRNPLVLHIRGVSRHGVVKGDLPICMESATPPPPGVGATEDQCAPPQPFFQMVSWSSTETASGSEDSLMCDSLGIVDQAKGTLDVGTTLPSPQAGAPPDNTLTAQGGHIFDNGVHETFSNFTTHNCSFDPGTGEEVPCDNTAPDHTATEQDGVGLLQPSGGMVPVEWPNVGANLGAIDDKCSVFFSNNLSFDEELTQVPLSTFQTPGEHTITFTGSKRFTEDSLGTPASIDYAWSFSLTFEVVSSPGA